MKKMVQNDASAFRSLDALLDTGKCYVFKNCELPDCCKPQKSRIGFEKNNGKYHLFVDFGIVSTSSNEQFNKWLNDGSLTFNSIDELEEFFVRCRPLFKNDSEVVNKEELKKLQEKMEVIHIWPEDITVPIKKVIFGQEEAIDSIGKCISIHFLQKEKRLLVMTFMGPPATGKSETARLISKQLSKTLNQEYGYIEIGANEMQQEHMISKILGSPSGYVGYKDKTVLEPVRKNPYHVIVWNEIEKAHPALLVSLMEALETGKLGMADNSKSIDLSNCIMIFTSNIPIDISTYNQKNEFEKAEMCKDVFTKACGRPEISRRIHSFMVYQPLSDDATISVIVKFTREALHNYGAELVKIESELMLDFLNNKTKYGASEYRNYVESILGSQIVKTHNLDLVRGKKVVLKGRLNDLQINIL